MNPGFRETTLTSYLTCSIGDLDVFPLGPWVFNVLKPRQLVPVV